MNENQNGVSDERMTYLKLFNAILRWEHENKRTKEKSDKQMQDKIKKQIQTMVKSD